MKIVNILIMFLFVFLAGCMVGNSIDLCETSKPTSIQDDIHLLLWEPLPEPILLPPFIDWSEAYLIYEAKTPDLEEPPAKKKIKPKKLRVATGPEMVC